MLLAILCLLILMFTGCKSKLKLVEKKQETVSVLEINDIKTSEQVKSDISTLLITNSHSLKATPIDKDRPMQFISGKDTVSVTNASIEIEASASSESKEDKTVSEKSTSDQSTKKSESDSSEKTVDIKKTGTHPAFIWGGLLLILILIVLAASWSYLKKKLPFL